jgi:hypothetical protein
MLLAAEIVDTAVEQLQPGSSPDPSCLDGLNRLVASFNKDARLNELGEAVVARVLTDKLVNRLQIDEWCRQHPDIAQQKVECPVFGIGLPRTGSTALGVMLGQDPGRRVLRTWEARKPCPPPRFETGDTDPRIAEMQAELDAMLALEPSLGAMIPISAHATTECLILTSMDFRSKEFGAFGMTSSYDAWLMECDMVPTYRFHKQVLQLLQWRCPPNRWFLRTPQHTAFLPALDAIYPDARFVMTHRDITKVIPSNMTFVLALTKAYTDCADLRRMARHMVDFWEAALRRLVAFREAGNDYRFYDIAFAAFQSDPIDEARKLYAWLGEPLTKTAEQNMLAWWRAQGEERHSPSKIDFSELGLSMDELRHRFAFYTERYVA